MCFWRNLNVSRVEETAAAVAVSGVNVRFVLIARLDEQTLQQTLLQTLHFKAKFADCKKYGWLTRANFAANFAANAFQSKVC